MIFRGNTSMEIVVTFVTVDETATSMYVYCIYIIILSLLLLTVGEDYLSHIEDITFHGSGPQVMSSRISILNDDHVEDTESFRVTIHSSISRGVNLDPDSTQVVITNPEGGQCFASR